MDLISLIAVAVFLGWVAFYALAFALYLIEHVDEIIYYYRERSRERRLARSKARANTPQPWPLYGIDPTGLVTHEAVLSCLSQSVVGDFTSPSTPNITLIESEPVGSRYLRAELGGSAYEVRRDALGVPYKIVRS